jgi:hypothetical protein
MPRQISLDLRNDQLRGLWSRLPDGCRRQAVAIWAQLIASAARGPSDLHGVTERNR